MKHFLFLISFLLPGLSNAHGIHLGPGYQAAYADLQDLRALDLPVFASDQVSGVGLTYLNDQSAERLSHYVHSKGKCGGFEVLADEEAKNFDLAVKGLSQLGLFAKREVAYMQQPFRLVTLSKNSRIAELLTQVNEDYLREDVEWLSSFPSRFNKGPEANRHVFALRERLERMLAGASMPFEIELISHQSTPQQTLKVRLVGSKRPDEIIVLGGHLDSVVQGRGNSSLAPGADDNASGSANLIEALRLILEAGQTERSIEFYWYAGEESGLLGSGEIAKNYKSQKKDVIGVVQLDMTLYPGSGVGTIASMTDFTSAWMREMLVEINRNYLGATIVDDKCGYGCSDHASWHRQGYAALMPFEAKSNAMNRNIHTVNDKVSPALNFTHSALYTKLAIVFALELGNSQLRQPY